MLRKLVAAIIGVSALVPGSVFGLGMGEVELKSFLNQPLDARIELLQTRGLSPAEILANLAGHSEFSAAGVDRSFFLSQLQFEVIQGEKGKTFLKVVSKRPVTEPFLNFLVEVQWPAGRLLREYTLLLDPPEFKDELPLAIRAAQLDSAKTPEKTTGVTTNNATVPKVEISTDEQATTTTIKAQQKKRAGQQQRIAEPDLALAASKELEQDAQNKMPKTAKRVPGSTISSKTYTVKSGDNLSSIVARTQPNADLPLAQTMVAYQYLNPDAFIDGNINLVRRGSVLRIPTEAQVVKIGRQEALQEIAKQNKAWRAKANIPQKSVKKDEPLESRQLDGTGRDLTPVKTPSTKDEGRLSLVTTDAQETVKEGASSGGKASGDAKQLATLKNKLTLEREETEKYSVANDGLVAELEELASLTEKTDKVLTLKDNQIASLQAQLEELRLEANPDEKADAGTNTDTPTDSTSLEPAQANMPSAQEPAEANAQETNAQETGAPETDPTQSSSQEADIQEPANATPQSEPESSFDDKTQPEYAQSDMDQQFDQMIERNEKSIWANPLVLGAGGALGLGIVGLLWSRSRSDDDDDFEDEDEDDDFEDDLVMTQKQDDQPLEPEINLGKQAFSTVELDRQLLEANDDFDIDTVLSEADIYVAYGHFPKAITMLKSGLEESPNSIGLNLKLMEVYAESKDVDSFQQSETHVRSFAQDDKTLMQINSMRKDLGLPAGEGPVLQEDEFDEEETQFLGGEELTSAQAPHEDLLSLADIEAELDVGTGFDELEASAEPLPKTDDPLSIDDDFLAEETQVDTTSDLDSVSLDEELDLSGGALDFNFEETSVPDEEFSPGEMLAGIDEEFSPGDMLAGIDEEIDHLDEQPALDGLEQESAQPLDEFATNLDSLSFDEDPVIDQLDTTSLTDPASLAGGDSVVEPFGLKDEAVDLDADFSLDDNLLVSEDEPAQESLDFSADALESQASDVAARHSSLSAEDASLLDGIDEVSTKLDLATAYIEMGDQDGAKDILDEVLLEGTDTQQQLARDLLAKVS